MFETQSSKRLSCYFVLVLFLLMMSCKTEEEIVTTEVEPSKEEQILASDSFRAIMEDTERPNLKLFPTIDYKFIYDIKSVIPLSMVKLLGSAQIKEIKRDKDFSVIPYIFMPCDKIANGVAEATIDFLLASPDGKPLLAAAATQVKVRVDSLYDSYGVCSFIADNFLISKFSLGVPSGKYMIKSNLTVAPSNIVSTAEIELKLID